MVLKSFGFHSKTLVMHINARLRYLIYKVFFKVHRHMFMYRGLQFILKYTSRVNYPNERSSQVKMKMYQIMSVFYHYMN